MVNIYNIIFRGDDVSVNREIAPFSGKTVSENGKLTDSGLVAKLPCPFVNNRTHPFLLKLSTQPGVRLFLGNENLIVSMGWCVRK